MALAITELDIVNCDHHMCKKRVYIESAMPSAMSHLNRGLHLRNKDSF